MHSNRTVIHAVLVAVIGASLARGAMITYTEQTIASGTLGVTAFTNALLTITLTRDTSGVAANLGIFANVGFGSVSIAGVGTAAFVDTIAAFDYQRTVTPAPSAGFSDIFFGPIILYTSDAAFSTYDLTTSIGPVTSAGGFGRGAPFNTSLGKLMINSAGNTTFTAVVAAPGSTGSTGTSGVPEPASFILFGIGLVAVAACKGRAFVDTIAAFDYQRTVTPAPSTPEESVLTSLISSPDRRAC